MGTGLLSQFMLMAITAENLHTRSDGRSSAVKVLGREAAIIIAPEGRHHHPLNLLNLLNPLNLYAGRPPLVLRTTFPPASGGTIG